MSRRYDNREYSRSSGIGIDPGMNNEPLQFNSRDGSDGLPPRSEMDMMSMSMSGNLDLSGYDMSGSMMPSNHSMGMGPDSAGIPMGATPLMGMGAAQGGPQSALGFDNMNSGNAHMDPTYMPYMMGGELMGVGVVSMPVKETFEFKGGIMVAPSSTAAPPPMRERPPGCRTIFIGGLPEEIKEEMIEDIFSRCGPITSIRMSKKKFAHLRYEQQESVDMALLFSGYRMKIENKDEKEFTGRLHVDYAQARDDLHEWECQQRAIERERRHRERLERDRLRPPSPPKITLFSEHEAHNVSERLKDENDFMRAVTVLNTWLDRGDCNKRSAATFYSLIQTTSSNVRRLTMERHQHEDDYARAKEYLLIRLEGLASQLEQVQRVFEAATKQRSWDHFTKAQRKNIDNWRRSCQEQKEQVQNIALKYRGGNEEMEMSDTEDVPVKHPRVEPDTDFTKLQLEAQLNVAKVEANAYKNEIEAIRGEKSEELAKQEKKIETLQQTLQGMQKQLLVTSESLRKEQDASKQLKAKINQQETSPTTSTSATVEGTEHESPAAETSTVTDVTDFIPASTEEVRLTSVVATFLHVHPFGASVEYIWSYLQRLNFTQKTTEIEGILERYPSVFQKEMCGVGASLENRWKFIAFNSDSAE